VALARRAHGQALDDSNQDALRRRDDAEVFLAQPVGTREQRLRQRPAAVGVVLALGGGEPVLEVGSPAVDAVLLRGRSTSDERDDREEGERR
jgi:hypothetical protein